MAAQALQDVPEQWPIEGREDLYRSDLPFALRSDQVTAPGRHEEPFTRVVLEHPGACVILAVDDRERVLVLRQYRHPVGHRLVELPAGLMDVAGESPEHVARRELAEEAGLQAHAWTLLASVFSSPGISAEAMHLFLARGLSAAERSATDGFVARHEEADMTTAWVPFAELREAVLAGRLADAPLVMAVLLADGRGLVG
jgi:ADP-ribose pyrophosphatase